MVPQWCAGRADQGGEEVIERIADGGDGAQQEQLIGIGPDRIQPAILIADQMQLQLEIHVIAGQVQLGSGHAAKGQLLCRAGIAGKHDLGQWGETLLAREAQRLHDLLKRQIVALAVLQTGVCPSHLGDEVLVLIHCQPQRQDVGEHADQRGEVGRIPPGDGRADQAIIATRVA